MPSRTLIALVAAACAAFAQSPGRPGQQPDYVREAMQSLRDGKTADAVSLVRREVGAHPDSGQANTAMGTVLDLAGQTKEAKTYFQKAISLAQGEQALAAANRNMAMSYAFDGDCANAVKYGALVFGYHVSKNDFFQQGEAANEIARVCIDAGDLDTAEKWYRNGRDAGLQEPNIDPDRVALWRYRWEHAHGRIAARRGDKAGAAKDIAEARKLLDEHPEMAKQQEIFFPYLTGYVAFYSGDYRKALADLQKANQNDAFIQTLIGETYEKLGDREKALEYYRKAVSVAGHNPPAAYAHRIAGRKLAQNR
jgi:Flp pilus assembly protein TadD